MRKHMIALLGFLSGAMVYYIKAPAPAPAITADEFHQQEFVTTTQSAAHKENRAPARVVPVTAPPADFHEEEFQDYPGLPRGMKFAPNVKAVPVEEYKAELGPRLMEKNGFVFFHTENATNSSANVVYDKRLDTFHPLTATIKLTGVTEEIRNEILNQWEEYHYNKDLGIQYVQSTHDGLLKDFENLKKSGLKASLEVIQAVYQSR